MNELSNRLKAILKAYVHSLKIAMEDGEGGAMPAADMGGSMAVDPIPADDMGGGDTPPPPPPPPACGQHCITSSPVIRVPYLPFMPLMTRYMYGYQQQQATKKRRKKKSKSKKKTKK